MAKKSKASVAKAMEVEYEYKPSLELTDSMYKGLKDLKVDDVVNIELKVKITSIRRQQYGEKKELCVSAEIQNAKPDYDEN
jgi:hypothetical protein